MQCLQPFYGVLLLELLIFHTQVEFEQIYALNAELFSKPKMNLRSASRKTMATPPARVRVQFVDYYQWYALPSIPGAWYVQMEQAPIPGAQSFVPPPLTNTPYLPVLHSV